MDATSRYYHDHAIEYFESTKDADTTLLYDHFLKYISSDSVILDLGCGSGRDTKAFLDKGYSVHAIDGSESLCKLASEYTGITVECLDFNQLNKDSEFDAVWACASLLHLSSEELPKVLRRIHNLLNPNGIVYMSFKYGCYEGVRDGRYYTDMTSERLAVLLKEMNVFTIVEEWCSDDVRSDQNVNWYNVILRKV